MGFSTGKRHSFPSSRNKTLPTPLLPHRMTLRSLDLVYLPLSVQLMSLPCKRKCRAVQPVHDQVRPCDGQINGCGMYRDFCTPTQRSRWASAAPGTQESSHVSGKMQCNTKHTSRSFCGRIGNPRSPSRYRRTHKAWGHAAVCPDGITSTGQLRHVSAMHAADWSLDIGACMAVHPRASPKRRRPPSTLKCGCVRGRLADQAHLIQERPSPIIRSH